MGGCSRPSASSHLDRPLAPAIRRDPSTSSSPNKRSPPPRPPRARSVLTIAGVGTIGSHAMPGGDHPQLRITVAGVPAFLAINERRRNWLRLKLFSLKCHLPSELIMRATIPCLLPTISSSLPLFLHRSLAYISLRIPWALPRGKEGLIDG